MNPTEEIEKQIMELAVGEVQMGERIKHELKRQRRTMAWLALQLQINRSTLYYYLRRSSIDTNTLTKISVLLNYNFFVDLSDLHK